MQVPEIRSGASRCATKPTKRVRHYPRGLGDIDLVSDWERKVINHIAPRFNYPESSSMAFHEHLITVGMKLQIVAGCHRETEIEAFDQTPAGYRSSAPTIPVLTKGSRRASMLIAAM